MPLLLLGKNRKHIVSLKDLKHVPDLKTLINVFATFTLTTFAWVFFRSNTIADAINYLKRIIVNSDYTSLSSNSTMNNTIWPLFIFIGFFIIVEWLNRDSETVISRFLLERKFMRYSFYFLILILIIININNEASGFIYFQF